MQKLGIILLCAVIAVTASFAQQASTTVNVAAQVQPAAAFVSVQPSSFDFGLLDPVGLGVSRIRQVSSTMTCTWQAVQSTFWAIEVTTSNANHLAGLVDPGGNNNLVLKFRQDEFNLPGEAPDPDNDAQWDGIPSPWQSSVYKFVFDPFNDGPGFPGSDGLVEQLVNFVTTNDADSVEFDFVVQVFDSSVPDAYSGDIVFDLVTLPPAP